MTPSMNAPDPMDRIIVEATVSNAARAGAADVLSFRALARTILLVARRPRHVVDLNASLTRAINLSGDLASRVLHTVATPPGREK